MNDVAREQRRGRDDVHLPSLVWTVVRTDLKTRYHKSFGGYLWTLLRPLVMFFVLLSVFSFVFRMDPNYNLNLIIGLFLWDFFAEATRSGMAALASKSYLITKARFPAWVLVATSSVNAAVNLIVFGSVIALYVGLGGRGVGAPRLALFALYLALFAATVLGLSFATSVLFLRFRDLNQFWDLALQAGFFVAPIVYPLDIIPERLHFYLYLWLPTPIIQFSREVLVQGTPPTLRAHLYLLASVAMVLGAGILIFRRLIPRAIETL
jgi:lipopolysaccharide transport system permease protein